MSYQQILYVVATLSGIGGDVLLCALAWKFLIRPGLIKLIDERVRAACDGRK